MGKIGIKSEVIDLNDRKIEYQNVKQNKKTENSKAKIKRKLVEKKLSQTQEEEAFTCLICQESFRKQCYLKLHHRLVHTESRNKLIEPHFYNRYPCKICHCVYPKKKDLKRHYFKKHKGEKIPTNDDVVKFICAECGKKFQLKHRLRKHILVLCKTQKVACPVCNVVIGKWSMKRHMQKHSGQEVLEKVLENIINPDVDDIHYVTPELINTAQIEEEIKRSVNQEEIEDKNESIGPINQLKIKEEMNENEFSKGNSILSNYSELPTITHSGIISHYCMYCPKTYTLESELKIHLRSHMVYKRYVCEYCKKSFLSYTRFKRHLDIHLLFKPFKCRHCEKYFSESKFKVHVKIHEKTDKTEESILCTHCGQFFTDQESLKTHILAVHSAGV